MTTLLDKYIDPLNYLYNHSSTALNDIFFSVYGYYNRPMANYCTMQPSELLQWGEDTLAMVKVIPCDTEQQVTGKESICRHIYTYIDICKEFKKVAEQYNKDRAIKYVKENFAIAGGKNDK